MRRPTFRRVAVPVVVPALSALRSTGGVAAVILLAGAVAFLAVAPVEHLAAPGQPAGTILELPGSPLAQAAVNWTDRATGPGVAGTTALATLFELLRLLAWVAFGLGAITILATSLVRSAIRGPETSVRRAVGASRRGLLLSLLAEGAVLTATALAAGLVLGWVALGRAVAAWPGPVAAAGSAPVLPALLLAATIGLGALGPLRWAGARNLADPSDGQVRLGVPAVQLGLSLAVLLAGAMLVRRPPPPAGPAGGSSPLVGLVFEIDSGTRDPAARADRFRSLLQRLSLEPRFDTVTLAAPGELAGLGTTDVLHTDCGSCFSGGIILRYHRLDAVHHFVSPDAFAARGNRLLAGRAFNAGDRWDAPRVAIVNRHLAQRHFEGGRAVGRPLFLSDGFLTRPYLVVGVVNDERARALGGSVQPRDAVYLSVLQHPPAVAQVLVRPASGRLDGASVRDSIAAALGGGGSVGPAVTEAEVLEAGAAPLDWFGRGFESAGLVALLLAIGGTFATMGLWVRSLAPELALRRAVGASRWHVAGYVLLRAAATGAGGAGLGLFVFASVLFGAVTSTVARLAPPEPGLTVRLALLLVGAALAGALMPLIALLRRPPALDLP